MHSRNRYTISVMVYMPAPMVKPRILQAHRPADVVSPLIWLRELNRMEFPLISAVEIMVAADRTGIPKEKVSIR